MSKISKRILIADDERTMRRLCVDVLTLAGYNVDSASDGIEALEKIEASDYDVVITDITMPRLDGIGFYHRATQERPDLKKSFLFMSGGLTKEANAVIKDQEAMLLIKPFKITDLVDYVDRIMVALSQRKEQRIKGCIRNEQRFDLSVLCEVTEKDTANPSIVHALTKDISRHGLRISFDEGTLRPGQEVNFYMATRCLRLVRSAKVVWSEKSVEGGAGLGFTKPLPLLSLMDSVAAENKAALAC